MNLKAFTAFSGYDSQCMALDRLSANFPDKFSYRLVGWSEIDKYAIRAHNALYPEASHLNFGDISKINWNEVPDFDLFTYSFPCTDVSQAGRQQGLVENSGTRSSLLWECRKAIEAKRPKFLVMENVKALVSEKFKPTGWQHIKYGALYSDWRDLLAKGFAECFRVLKPGGFLIFKWNETDIKVTEILKLTPAKPIFGHISGKRANTHWLCFMKGGAE